MSWLSLTCQHKLWIHRFVGLVFTQSFLDDSQLAVVKILDGEEGWVNPCLIFIPATTAWWMIMRTLPTWEPFLIYSNSNDKMIFNARVMKEEIPRIQNSSMIIRLHIAMKQSLITPWNLNPFDESFQQLERYKRIPTCTLEMNKSQ